MTSMTKNPPYVIDEQTGLEKLVDNLASILLWIFFLYLLRGAPLWVIGVFDHAINHAASGASLVVSLWGYLQIVILNAVIFIVWAIYNRVVFAHLHRRRIPAAVTVDETAQSFHVDAAAIPTWQMSQRMVVYYDRYENIEAISTGWEDTPYRVQRQLDWDSINNY